MKWIKEAFKKGVAFIGFFFRNLFALPSILQKKAFGYLGMAFLFLALSIAMSWTFHDKRFLFGILAAAYLVVPFFTVVKDYYEGKIIEKKAVCTKIKKPEVFRKEQYLLYFREPDASSDSGTMMYKIAMSRTKARELEVGNRYRLFLANGIDGKAALIGLELD